MNKKKNNDRELALAAQNGSRQAYNDLFKRYEKPLLYFVKKMIKDEMAAEDIVMISMQNAFSNLEKYQPRYAFSTWIYTITNNNCIDFLRSKIHKTSSRENSIQAQEEVYVQLMHKSLNPEDLAILKDDLDIAKEFIEAIPERYKEIFKMRVYDQFSYKEIAENMQMPLGTVKGSINRAREFMGSMR